MLRPYFVPLILLMLFALLAITVGIVGRGGPLPIDSSLIAVVAPLRGSIDNLMKAATVVCSWQVVVTAAAVLIVGLAIRRHVRTAILVLIAVVGDEIIVSSLKALFHRSRPDQALAIMPAAGYSFPSGHTFICVAFYGLLACLAFRQARSPWLKGIVLCAAVALVVAVGTSRIYLGAHWPTDVLGSVILGGAWIALLLALYERRRVGFAKSDIES